MANGVAFIWNLSLLYHSLNNRHYNASMAFPKVHISIKEWLSLTGKSSNIDITIDFLCRLYEMLLLQ